MPENFICPVHLNWADFSHIPQNENCARRPAGYYGITAAGRRNDNTFLTSFIFPIQVPPDIPAVLYFTARIC
jgi:hypothetical protein